MLLKFVSSDILNSVLEDATTGTAVYKIATSTLEEAASSSTSTSDTEIEPAMQSKRRTSIYDSKGTALCDITWHGRKPSIRVGATNFEDLSQLYDTCAARITYVSHLNVQAIPG
jgi:hypothetical protein